MVNKNNTTCTRHVSTCLLGFGLLFLGAPVAYAKHVYNLTSGVTPISHEIYGLHMLVFWVCVGIASVVFSVMIFSLMRYRKSRGVTPATFHQSTVVEIIWAVIPLLILIGIAIPATKVLMHMEDNSQAEVNIKITGYQWKWEYSYVDEGVHFFSNMKTSQDEIHNKVAKQALYVLDVDHPLVVPIHRKIRFLVTSNDVIHAWWVPALGIKQDAIPGFIHEAWARIDRPGTYRGQCAELCGMHHAYMPIVVIAKPEAAYQAWLRAEKKKKPPALMHEGASGLGGKAHKGGTVHLKKWSKAKLMEVGKMVYGRQCSVCHQPDGGGMPPVVHPIHGSPIVTGDLRHHIELVLYGVTGTAMQAFGNQLTDEEVAAVVTYQRNSWGNQNKKQYGQHAGGMVQPKQVRALRAQSSH